MVRFNPIGPCSSGGRLGPRLGQAANCSWRSIIRALSGREPSGMASIERTNNSLGICQRFLWRRYPSLLFIMPAVLPAATMR